MRVQRASSELVPVAHAVSGLPSNIDIQARLQAHAEHVERAVAVEAVAVAEDAAAVDNRTRVECFAVEEPSLFHIHLSALARQELL